MIERCIVRIICRTDTHKSTKPVVLGKFELSRDTERADEHLADGTSLAQWHYAGQGWMGRQLLDGDRPVSDRDVSGSPSQALDFDLRQRARRKYEYECRQCGLKADAREETLIPIVISHATHGKLDIRLADLATRL